MTLMKTEGKGNQQDLLEYVKNVLAVETSAKINQRKIYEDQINLILSENRSVQQFQQEKLAWQQYIEFEIKQGQIQRAKLVYESALITLDQDLQFWISYINFLQRNLQDIALVRAKFEIKLQHCSRAQIIDLMIENALFEEEQSQIQKARRIFEQLTQEIAPGHLKSQMALISFERRQNNIEKAKELSYQAFKAALESNNCESATFLAMQYARFLIFVCNDLTRGCDVLEQATNKFRSSKVLFLSHANILKHLPSTYDPKQKYEKIVKVYQQALFEQDDLPNSQMSLTDRQDVAKIYFEYLKENCQSAQVLRTTEQKLAYYHMLYSANYSEQQKVQNSSNGGVSLLGKRANPESIETLEKEVK